MTSIVLTRPMGTGSTLPGSVATNITIPPTVTQIVDQCSWAVSSSVKWIYTLVDSINGDTLTAEVLGTHRNGSNPTHNRYGIIGDTLLHQATVDIFGGNIGLQITNQNSNTLIVSVVRIQILS